MKLVNYNLKSTIVSLVLVVLLFSALPLLAQNARLQLIHNSGDIDAANLEVLVNGDSTTTFAFREATPFEDFAPGEYVFQFVATIGAETDTSAADTVTLDGGVSYVGVVGGITATNIGEAKYDNPFSRDISMQLFVLGDARETANDPTKVEFVGFHGSTDAPALDLVNQATGSPIVDNIDYGQFTNYIALDPAVYTLDVTPGDDNSTVIASFEADLSGLAGATAVVFTSGFLVPENNESASKIGLFAALANGDVVTFEDVTPGEPGPWQFVGLSEYEFDSFIGADTLVSGGHGIAVDKFNRIWNGNFFAALRVISPDGIEADFSPIDSITVGATTIPTTGCRGLAIAHDGNILFARSGGDFAKINVETGEGMAFWKGGGSLLKPAVDAQGFIYVGLVVGINPISVLDPQLFTPIQEITLNVAPSFGRGLEVTADGKTIYTPDLGGSGGPVFIWTSEDLITYTKTDSIFNNTEGKQIFLTQRTTMNWGPDSTLWVSSDNAYAAGNNDPNGFVILDFSTMEYKFLPSPEIAPGVGNGPRGVAFSVTGDTAYATYFNGNRLARFVKQPVSVDSRRTSIPSDYILEQNYPNPFNPTTTIAFKIAQKGMVELKVYNLLGQEVVTLLNKSMPAGRHEVTFDASGIASGTYYYQLSVNDKVLSKKMLLIK
jgi:DNA-binding beta-propeller fold protein YncE